MQVWNKHKGDIPLFAIYTSSGCSWRAVYIHVRAGSAGAGWHGKQIAHLGIDPGGQQPAIFGAVGRWDFRVPARLISWPLAARFRWLMPLYRAQQRFLLWLDGRY